MLIEFRVENHRSIRDEQAITMEASLLEDPTDVRPRAVEGNEKKLLPVAALYGANASGKTNMLEAMDSVREAVLYSHRSWAPDGGIPRSPFAWGPKRIEPSEFVATLLIDGVRYEYGFVAGDMRFEEEWLFAWPNGRKQSWFERDGMVFTFGENLKGENRLTERITRPNSLFLSAAIQNNYEQLAPIHRWFASLKIETPSSRRRPAFQHEYFYHRIIKLVEDTGTTLEPGGHRPPVLANDWRELLQNSDFGIRDVKIDYKIATWGDQQEKHPHLLFQHGTKGENAWLPLESQSRGTQTMLRIALPLLEVIASGGVLVVDELEASLHPMLAAKIVQQFNDPKTNPKNAQLIFTTHDTNLLGNVHGDPLLRRDQVWFTEKNKEGATVVYPLTDYKPRKAENLERGYLQGRYGAIPFLGNLRFGGEDE